jgi:tetratricopeptide (TPR) repeat protein
MKRSILRQVAFLSGFLALSLGYIQAQDLNTATQLTRSEQFEQADAMLNQLIQKEPANGKNYFFLGENFLLDYFTDTISNSLVVYTGKAKDAYQKGISASANDPLNYIGLAKVAYYLGDDKSAAEMRAKAKSFLLPYKNIKKIVPPAGEYAFALAKIAESYIREGEVDTSASLPLIREAIKIDNKNKDIYLIAGDIYMLVNDGSSAIKNYNLAQFADPQSPTANMKIGYVYVKGRALQQAIPFFEEAIKLNANYAPAFRELGQLYLISGRFEQSKESFKKYLDLTQGNIPAKIRYVNALFYAKEYDEVVKNVEDIFAVDKSRTYMNRIAGYSCYEKNPPDYNKALSYMETLFKTVAPERIIQKDYLYMARILGKKNQNYPKMADDLNILKQQLEKEKLKSTAGTAAEKAKAKATVDGLTVKVANLEKEVVKANSELDIAYFSYGKALTFKPDDKNLLNELANSYAINKRYENAAKIMAKLLDPAKDNPEDPMRVGRAYYNGENFKTADSVFAGIVNKYPNYVPAYIFISRTYSKMDPDTKLGLAKPKFEKVIEVAKSDSVKWEKEMMEAFNYLSYYYMEKENYVKAKEYYTRMINLNTNNKENKINGYNGIASIETALVGNEKTPEGRLAYLAKANDAYERILEIDPANASAKNGIKYIQDYVTLVKKGINPNEIKGFIKDAAGAPIPYASIRVKDTAVEQMSNSKGEYKFEIPQSSQILLISAKGFKPKEIAITKAQRTYNVTLEK